MTPQEIGLIVEQKRPELLRYARSIGLGYAEDFVQDTALKAMENADKFRGGNIGGWLNRILTNVARDFLERESRRAEFVEEEQYCFTETMVDIEKAMRFLNEQQKQAIWLYAKGYNKREISEILKVPQGTIQTRIFYAQNKLRTILCRNF